MHASIDVITQIDQYLDAVKTGCIQRDFPVCFLQQIQTAMNIAKTIKPMIVW
jgi:hypothetical protein